MWKLVKKNLINNLPKSPGVYCFKDKKGRFLYIGKAANIKERVKTHFQQPSYRDDLFIKEVKKVGYTKTGSEIGALILETNLIKKYRPKFNVVWKDDKKYFYVGITKEDLPRVFLTHQPQGKNKLPIVNVQFIGPFTEGKPLKKTLRFLRKVFPYYTARKHPKIPCTYCYLGLCPGVQPDKKEYQKNIKNLISVLKGQKKSVLKSLKREMEIAAQGENFEKAAGVRNQIESLENIFEHARIFVLPIDLLPGLSHPPWKETEKTLKRILRINRRISRIEGYDVSNIQGKKATGSMVTFINGKPDKNFYRKFKIRITKTPNDVAMIEESLKRRFQHREWPYPDLVLIDGGKAQLNVAKKTLKSYNHKATIIALAKKNNELYKENEKRPILLENQPREIFNLILQIRDEAHRFARKYHHQLRSLDLQRNI